MNYFVTCSISSPLKPALFTMMMVGRLNEIQSIKNRPTESLFFQPKYPLLAVPYHFRQNNTSSYPYFFQITGRLNGSKYSLRPAIWSNHLVQRGLIENSIKLDNPSSWTQHRAAQKTLFLCPNNPPQNGSPFVSAPMHSSCLHCVHQTHSWMFANFLRLFVWLNKQTFGRSF